jgi:two-component system, sensor histidine kinase and response regulator
LTFKTLEMGRIVDEAQQRLLKLIEQYQPEMMVPPSADWPVALGYAPWVEEVWANYISNALKYGGQPPRLELGADLLDGGQQVRFWVKDNGPGLSSAEQARLFTPFTRIHTSRAEGHGLGLSIVQRIVDRQDGQAGAESEPGQGSRFFFTLPAA